MNIRPATVADRTAILWMARNCLAAMPYNALLTVAGGTDGTAALVDELLARGPDACALVAEDARGVCGMICLLAAAHVLTGAPYADEIAWWVEPDRRTGQASHRLLGAAEVWAAERGLVLVKMVAPAHSDVGLFYERHGYRPIETAYAKRLV